MNDFRSQIFGGPQRKESLLGAKRPRGAKAEVGLQSVSVPRAEIRMSDTRDGDRYRLGGEEAVIFHQRRRHAVELVNLSGGGAMVAASFTPLLWDRVELQFTEGAAISCIVRWIKDGRIGLEFEQGTRVDCSPADLQDLLHEVVARSFPEVAVAIRVPVESESARPAEKPQVEENNRRAERIPLVWSGQIHYDFTSTPIRIRNISATGALVECEFALPIGAEPLLDLGDSGQLFATVSWRRGDQIGLAFKTPFDISLLSRSKPAVAPVWRPPSSARPVDTSDDAPLNWDEMSADEMRDRLEGFLKR